MQTLLQHLDAPRASLRMLCAFTALHMAIEARSGNPAAQLQQLPGVLGKLLHVLALPACTVTEPGGASFHIALCNLLCLSCCSKLLQPALIRRGAREAMDELLHACAFLYVVMRL